MLKYTRNMQKGIYALLYDLSDYFGYSLPVTESYLKARYWGDREGEFSLALDKCLPHNAHGFYAFLLEIALECDIQFCVWESEKVPARNPLDWGFDKKELFSICQKHDVSAFNLKKHE